MQVTFTKHAVERMEQRLHVSIPGNTKVNIAPLFTKSHTYINTENNRKMIAFCSNDRSKQVVLVVDAEKAAVVTVYLGLGLNDQNAPFVTKCYAMLR
jgi:hypothetical protein